MSQINLTQSNVYFSVFASVQTIYRLKIDAEYNLIQPSDSTDNTFDNSSNGSTDSSIYLVVGQD